MKKQATLFDVEQPGKPKRPKKQKPERPWWQRKPRPIRLGCVHCDRTDGDMIEQVPPGWTDVVDQLETGDRGIGEWWTHLGLCPECQ